MEIRWKYKNPKHMNKADEIAIPNLNSHCMAMHKHKHVDYCRRKEDPEISPPRHSNLSLNRGAKNTEERQSFLQTVLRKQATHI